MKEISGHPIKKTVKQLKDLGVWSIFKDKLFAEEVADLNWLPSREYKDCEEFFFNKKYFENLLKSKMKRSLRAHKKNLDFQKSLRESKNFKEVLI